MKRERVDLADRIDLAEHLRTHHGVSEVPSPPKAEVKRLRKAWVHLAADKAHAERLVTASTLLRFHVHLHFNEALGRRKQAVKHWHGGEA